MRFLSISLCATALASSVTAFDVCWALGDPAVSIPLEIKGSDEVYYPVVRIDLEQSDKVCDPSGVRIFGQSLDVKDGRGKGLLHVSENYLITANWEFSCATPKDSSTEHKLVLTIESIYKDVSEEEVSDVNIVARFRQTHPVVFTSVESEALAAMPIYSRGTLHYGPRGPEPDTELGGISFDL
ncbi:hypothetical protein FSARC_4032 [Fusarium sarcochroum]|uniref:Uncharacterized protein n=1 Tax=Fusarium sarcochroum TaxID=1208366 RepID=A0A8H4U2L9_9HYPO|nr:hypothetical protein FSARC_4032 [Fusarium sarcochroum]